MNTSDSYHNASDVMVRTVEDTDEVEKALNDFYAYEDSVKQGSGVEKGDYGYNMYTNRPEVDGNVYYSDNNNNNNNIVAETNVKLPECISRFVSIGKHEDNEAIHEFNSVERDLRDQAEYFDFDWNGEYQKVYDSTASTPKQERERAAYLQRLIESFCEHCVAVARAILFGVVFPDRERLVQSSNVGGQAGGEKYVVGKVLYKFARDWQGLYGSDGQAEKAAKLELKVMNAVVKLNLRLVHTALTVLIRYRGHCVYATAMAPLRKLVYGSDSAGMHVEDGALLPVVVPVVRNVAVGLHVREHSVIERMTNSVKRMALAIDSELHVGSDNRFYLLDQARQMPPTRMPSGMKHESFLTPRLPYLTRHFRPELLRRARVNHIPPVSSDASSGFAIPTERERDDHDLSVMMAFLVDKVIPMLAQSPSLTTSCDLSQVFHSFGVNMRYLPLVAKRCNNAIRQYLVEDMYMRTLKCCIRHMWNTMTNCSERALLKCTYDVLVGLCSDESTGIVALYPQVVEKYCDFPGDTLMAMSDVNVSLSASIVCRVLNGLDLDFDGPLQSTDEKALARHSNSWRMRVETVSVEAPEFVPLADRENQLKEELTFLEGAGLPVLSTLRLLISLYRVWSEDEPAVSQARGIEIADRILGMVNRNGTNSMEVAKGVRDVCKFFKSFDMLERQRESSELLVSMCRSLDELTVASALKELASVLRRQGHHDEALTNLRESIRIRKSYLGEDNLEMTSAMNAVGLTLRQQGKYDEALSTYQESFRIKKKNLGDNHPDLAPTLNNIGMVLYMQKDYDGALKTYEECVRIKKVSLGVNHRDLGRTYGNMAGVYEGKGDMKSALRVAREALRIYTLTLPPQHSSLVRVKRMAARLENSQE